MQTMVMIGRRMAKSEMNMPLRLLVRLQFRRRPPGALTRELASRA